MIDYKLLEAFAAVIEHGGFERAGAALGLTQSAISQRVKLLEARMGQPVLVRGTEPLPTPIGRRLLNHFQQVSLLEQDLRNEIPGLASGTTRLRVAINADSLATWWARAIGDWARSSEVLLEHVIEDQDVGLERMRAGDVAACLCSAPDPVQGARCVALGTVNYRALASPAYCAAYFSDGLTAEALAVAPAIVFGPDDQLQRRFLRALGYDGNVPCHRCPSSEGFVRLAEAGLGYGLIPDIQVSEQLADGRLVDVAPERALPVPLYWHYWRQGGDVLDGLTRALTRSAGLLSQPPMAPRQFPV